MTGKRSGSTSGRSSRRRTGQVAAAAMLSVALGLGIVAAPQAQASATGPDGTAPVASARVGAVKLPSLTRRDLGRTLMGKTVYNPHGTWEEAVRRDDAYYGRLDTIRVYYPGLPKAWPGPAGIIHRPVPVSFRASPAEILSGRHDAELRRWFTHAPRKVRVWWTYIHEPEDQIAAGAFSAAQYRAAWRHLYRLSRAAHNPKLRPTLTLMCWTLEKGSGRKFSNYYPGNFIKTLAWDCYNQSWRDGVYRKPAAMISHAAHFSHRRGKGFAIGEWGSPIVKGDSTGAGRARWLIQFAKTAARLHAQYITYFDSPSYGTDFRLLDRPSRRAWRLITRKS